ncbi:hypothetical protein ASG11_05400 [Sphingomonas sp. Leaf357]|uniref:hypothetical protein n=1 Tax=Sphingomonas sp. Leaf357 TaxID=1736350 RepID=UPI000700D1D9|nr:hypothetical protein [Sphingomonas sp. Leaf357]KQS03750.1 hypothetical protein ASG11_05400 [Sphingomonas sp. Leaf357]
MTEPSSDLTSLLSALFGHFTVDDKTAMGRVNAALLAGLVTTGLGAMAAVGVALGKALITLASAIVNRHIIVQKLTLAPVRLTEEDARRVAVRCLLIRFGTDLYFEKLASDQERYEGRLQNRILRNRATAADRDNGWVASQFNLPIHNRLGTQFKFFLEVEEPDAPLGGIMMQVSDKIEEVARRERYFRIRLPREGMAPEMLVTMGENAEQAAASASAPSSERAYDERSEAYRIACTLADAYNLPKQDIVRRYKRKAMRRSVLCYRLWFTLADFPRVKTADGLENNMAFPI